MHINRQGLKFRCKICPLGAVYCFCHNYALKCLVSFVLLSKWALILFSCNQADLASVVNRVVASHLKKREGVCHPAHQWSPSQSLQKFPTAKSRITLQVPSPHCHSSRGRITTENDVPLSTVGWKSWLFCHGQRELSWATVPALHSALPLQAAWLPPTTERELWCLCPRRHSGMDGKSPVTVHSTGTLNKQKIMAGSSHLRMGDSVWPALFSECREKSVLIAQTSEQLL